MEYRASVDIKETLAHKLKKHGQRGIKTWVFCQALISSDHSLYKTIKEQTDAELSNIYSKLSHASKRTKVILLSVRVSSGVVSVGLITWTYYIVQDGGWSWRAIVTGIYAFGFIFYVIIPSSILRRILHRI